MVKALDRDLPKQALRYELRAGAGPVIQAETGEFSWAPTSGEVREEAYPITILVSDGVETSEVSFKVRVMKAEGDAKGGPAQVIGPIVEGGQFKFHVIGSPGKSYGVEASVDLVNWSPVGSVTTDAAGAASFSEKISEDMRMRFYRAVPGNIVIPPKEIPIEIISEVPPFTNQKTLTIKYRIGSLEREKSFELVKGPNKLAIVEEDAFGNRGEKVLQVTLDTDPPQGFITFNNGIGKATPGAVPLSVNVTDTGSGVTGIRYRVNGDGWSEWKLAVPPTIQLSKAGTNVIVIQAQDRAGNVKDFPTQIEIVAPVLVVKTDKYYEITNGLTGVRIPVQELFNPANASNTLAPLQAVRYADGQWSDDSSNYIHAFNGSEVFDSRVPKGMKVTFLSEDFNGATAEIFYDFGQVDGKTAYYKSTITVKSGEQAFVVKEESENIDVDYSLKISGGMNPTQARYLGHHATSVENGHFPDGSLYGGFENRLQADALLDLKFEQRKDYRPLAVWDPWIFDSGWYWQVYDKDGTDNSNVFGMFAGHASEALGVGLNGVHLFTSPNSVSASTAECTNGGHCYSSFQKEDGLWLLDLSTPSNRPELLAQGLINPSLQIVGNGLMIVAQDSTGKADGTPQWVIFEKPSNGALKRSTINLDLDTTILEPYSYLASTASYDFLLFYGKRAGKKGLLLYSRDRNGGDFRFEQIVEDAMDTSQPDLGSQSNRPAFQALADGRVVLLYTDFGGWAAYREIGPGQRTFSRYERFYAKFQLLNFGATIDSAGNMMIADSAGALNLLVPSNGQLATDLVKTPLNLALDRHMLGPNRRTMASDDQGNILVVHKDAVQDLIFLYRSDRKAWENFPVNGMIDVATAVVKFDKVTNQFNIIGFSQNSIVQLAYKVGDSLPRLVKQFSDITKQETNIQISLHRRNVDARVFPHIRYEWGIFTGTKGKDLKDPSQIQTIGQVMNRLSGLGDGRLGRYESWDYADSPFVQNGLFMSKETLQAMIQKVKTDETYYRYLYNAEPTIRDLIDYWRAPSTQKNHAIVQSIKTLAEDIKKELVNGNGIYSQYQYWHGGLQMMRAGVRIAVLLLDERTSAEDKQTLKAIASLFGHILWDNDLAPMFEGHGLNMGTENMPLQYRSYRDFYAILLADHPDFKDSVQGLVQRTVDSIRQAINEYGAEISSPHYAQPSIEPTLIKALLLKQAGIADLFKTEDRLRKFAEFYVSLLTPQEVRFGKNRKLVSIGDGSTEGTEILGLLAMGFRDVDPVLSARLMGAWNEAGKVHSGFFGSTLLMIDENLPSTDPLLGSGNYPGYDTVMRHGWGTPNESALWFINGDFYRDHRHQDQGSFALYALGAPLSVDWGSFYKPYAPGAQMHNTLLPASMIPWGGNTVSLSFPTPTDFNRKSTVDEVAFFSESSFAKAHFERGNERWDRTVQAVHYNDKSPIYVIRDHVNSSEDYVMTLNLMAQGSVETPAGSINPPLRSYSKGEEPSLGQVFKLNAGVNRLGFTGQWGVDFDVYTISDQPQEAAIGNWAHNEHPSTEQSQFQVTNGQPFEERQDILRVKGKNEFKTLILPYAKGQRPADLQVIEEGESIVIRTGNEETVIGEHFSTYTNGATQIVTSYGSQPVEKFGVSISGGPAEAKIESSAATLILHGNPGTRKIKLSGNWQVKPEDQKYVRWDSLAQEWQIDYTGNTPLEIHFIPTP